LQDEESKKNMALENEYNQLMDEKCPIIVYLISASKIQRKK